MADSRSGLFSRSSSSGPTLLSRSSQPSRPNFECRLCGGSEFTVETRRGTEVWLRSLRMYQQVAMGDFEGTHNVYTCVRCAASVEAAHAAVRDRILAKLLFAAKHLAERQFSRQNRYGVIDLICVECRVAQVADSFLRHKEHCSTGRVLKLLEALMGIDDPRVIEEALGCGDGSFSLPVAVAESRASDGASLARQNGGVQ